MHQYRKKPQNIQGRDKIKVQTICVKTQCLYVITVTVCRRKVANKSMKQEERQQKAHILKNREGSSSVSSSLEISH